MVKWSSWTSLNLICRRQSSRSAFFQLTFVAWFVTICYYLMYIAYKSLSILNIYSLSAIFRQSLKRIRNGKIGRKNNMLMWKISGYSLRLLFISAGSHIRRTKILVILHLASVKRSKLLIRRRLKKILPSYPMTTNFQSTERTLFLCSLQKENE